MDEIKRNIERLEQRMVGSQAAVESNLTAQGAAIRHLATGQEHLEKGQQDLVRGHQDLAEGHRLLADAVRQLARAVEQVGRTVTQHGQALEENGRAITELQRSNTNLRGSFSEYRRDSDQMFGHLKAAIFVLESSTEMRFQKIEARLDEMDKRPPAA